MNQSFSVLIAAGGTGGHVIPALAVARELRRLGHSPFFVGTPTGIENRLVPAEGFPLEHIHIGGLMGVKWSLAVRTLVRLPLSIWAASRIIRRRRPAAIFSMGGYAAGPSMVAGLLHRIPMILMEPNAVAGFTNRCMGRFVAAALVNFESTCRQFPPGRAVVSGLPVREEFFRIQPRPPGPVFSLLITGGSRGARRLNEAARESWPLFRNAPFPVHILHQCGYHDYPELARQFAQTGLQGEVVPFIEDMPAAFAQADLVVCRSGAGAVAELAAAGKPAILVPFPYATRQHQLRNAEQMVRAGAARLVPDAEISGQRLFQEVQALASQPELLLAMGRAARSLARPQAAALAARLLIDLASGKKLVLTETSASETIP